MNIFLLGATGSIGTQVLEVIRNDVNYTLISISVGHNIAKAREIIREFHPQYVSVQEEKDFKKLQSEFLDITFGYGEESLITAATYGECGGSLINAVVGMVGLKPTIAAINKHRNILLANKETLVVAGDIITKLAKEKGVALIPIDSEHSAILQCLAGREKEEIKKIIITASGGTFRDKRRDELCHVRLEDVLKHPNWHMGKKITIDSATMVNKGLEVIEAHHLFGVDYENIQTIIHYESIIHSMVEFVDNSIMAQLATPDMRIPIQYALTYPHKKPSKLNNSFDWKSLSLLHFKEMDYERFPCLSLAYTVGKQGGIMPTVFNASNEAAVSLFIDGKIEFLDIEKIIWDAVNKAKNVINPSIDDIINTEREIKKQIFEKYRD